MTGAFRDSRAIAAAIGDVHARLQEFKIRAALFIERGNFSIHDRALRSKVMRENREFGILTRNVVAVARHDPHDVVIARGVDKAERANAVPFDLVQPVFARRRLAFPQLREHRGDDRRHRSAPRPCYFFEIGGRFGITGLMRGSFTGCYSFFFAGAALAGGSSSCAISSCVRPVRTLRP